MPQCCEVQSSFSVQGPVGTGLTQARLLHTNPLTQSALVAQYAWQLV